jgi:dihydropteroate synthase
MGILNATPDSFYNKGRESDTDALLRKAEQMLKEGARVLDIGGTSSKPGAKIIDVNLETERILPVIRKLKEGFPEAWLSVDTYHSQTAKMAVEAGVDIINDISGGHIDVEMIGTVAALKVPYIAMHIQGIPETMQIQPQYDDVVQEVCNHLRDICETAKVNGVYDVIIDPGFGFGKTVEHNFNLLRNLHVLRILGKPIMVGVSRKSMVCKPLKITAEEALNGTTALHVLAVLQGANLLRVHDVKEAAEAIALSRLYMG